MLTEKAVVDQMRAYVVEWINDVDEGLLKWPEMSQDVAYNLFTLNDFDGATRAIDAFVGNHLLSMLGSPDAVGAAYNLINNINQRVEDLVGAPIEDAAKYIRNRIILQVTGYDIETLKEFYSNPASYINTPGEKRGFMIGLPTDTSQKLDRLMGIENGVNDPSIKFNPEMFAAVKNTITLAKLLLLSPETLNQLIRDHGVVSIYNGRDNGYGQENAMLDFIRSLDANHQWRSKSIREGDVRPDDGSPRQHSEGMPLWMDCSARSSVFRVLFVDWENVNFPDLGESCSSKYGRIVNENSGKCLYVPGGSTEDGVMIQQFRCNNRDNQRWALLPSQSAEVAEGGGETAGDGQETTVGEEGPITFTIRNEKTGKCLDVPVEVQKMG